MAARKMKITGTCHCGQITYEAEVDPITITICHCTDCQRLTGTAWRAGIPTLPNTFKLNTGTPKTYIKTAASGRQRLHAFCSECGSPIYATSTDPDPAIVGLRVGGIDQRQQFHTPQRQIWGQSALSWARDLWMVQRSNDAF